ncbi:MAG: acetyl-CoA carboxylase biotin carboxyl carrier protein [Thermoanaerobaculia bacterium]
MLTFEQIKELMQLVAAHRLQAVEIERAGFRLRIAGRSEAPAAAIGEASVGPPPVAAPTAASAALEPAAAPTAAPTALAGVHVVTSPIVGTFYGAPNPEAPAFVQVGDRVRKGQVLCIVEAMKLMNEIESDVAGVVVEIFPKNSQPVEFGEPLFGIRLD